MLILTAGDKRYSQIAAYAVAKAEALGYRTVAYDLGGLGFGVEWKVRDRSFQKHGYYAEFEDHFFSTARHKPGVIEHCLRTKSTFVVYCDADAVVIRNIDEVAGDYDVGVTLRRPEEFGDDVPERIRTYRGRINAGVLFFNYGKAALRFLALWKKAMQKWPDDQWALNEMLCPNLAAPPQMYRGIRIRTFPSDQYNYCYFPEEPPVNAKILHYRCGEWEHLFEE
jgi:hypothetical protein